MESIHGYKGFAQDLTCRGFQFEVGKTFEEQKVEVCKSGFHFCEDPLDVFGYYPPGTSRYAEVEGSGELQKHGDDSKVACSKLHIKAEIGLSGLIAAKVKFVLDRVNWKDAKESNTGDYSAATNTGYRSAATNTGDYSAACVEGKESVAVAIGYDSKAKGALGCWIVLSELEERSDGYHIKDVQSVHVDGEVIKADTWYRLTGGTFEEVA